MKKVYVILFIIVGALFFSCENEKDVKPKKDSHNSHAQSKVNEPLFKLLSTEETGINYKNTFSPEAELEFYDFQYQFNGAGVGIADFNNDGLGDIFFSGNEVPNKLYLNKGNLKFEDITEKAGVALPDKWCNGVCLADVNNDGFIDIYLSNGGNNNAPTKANSLLINNGDLTFTEKAAEFGIADTGWSTQSVFFDYDNDQDLDLFVLNHPNIWYTDTRMSRDNYKNAILGADHFYENKNGKFVEIGEKVGLKQEIFGGYGLGVSVGDLDNNGYIDIYVSNDYDSPDYLYMNQGNGTFKEEIKDRTKHIALYSMGNDIADFNNDGLLDIIALDMSAEDHFRLKTQMGAMAPQKFYELVEFGLPHQYMYNTLQLNNGNGTFSEIGQLAGVASTDWSWAPLFADFDNDGFKDLLITNGYRLDDRDNDYNRLIKKKYGDIKSADKKTQREIFDNTPSTPLANYIYKNNGDYTFSKKTYEWGLSQKTFSQGAAFGDLDGDGDLDIVLNNMEDRAFVYENKANENLSHNYIKVKLNASNGEASGAIVKVNNQNGQQIQQFQTARGYMSSVEPILHFGLGENAGRVTIEVLWNDGTSKKTEAQSNSLVEIDKKGSAKSTSPNKNKPFIFEDISKQSGIDFTHIENEFDDFRKEILLPHRNSMHGPGLACGDLNGDGLEDIYIGGAHKQAGAVYFQNKNGSFSRKNIAAISADKAHEDLGAIIYDYDGDGDNDLYVVSGGNEFPEGDKLYADRLYKNDGQGNLTKTKGVLPEFYISGENVSAGDFDGDGDFDLFVGGRLIPETYPFPPESKLLRYENGKYIDVTSEVAPDLQKPGLVTNSAWIDYDGDNDLDLIVVGEWMPIMLLTNENGKLNWNKENELSEHVGWWSGLESGDFDGDGDMDFMVGNLGLNYKYKASKDAPFQVWCHDFDENGTLDIVLGYFDHGACYPVRGRSCSSQQMPFLKEKFPTFNEFAAATIKDVYGNKLDQALNYKATNFASVYVENLGNGKFKVTNLPQEAQFSMVTSIQHLNNPKGNAQVIMAGNLHTAEVETPRADAGIGVLLTLENGQWVTSCYRDSGVDISGDVKDMVVVKNSENQEILVISKNNTQPQVLKRVK